MVLTLPSGIDFSVATITFDYSSSDPNMIGPGPGFAPAPGSLRIWTKTGQTVRNPLDVAGGGDYVAGNVAHTAASLGFASGTTRAGKGGQEKGSAGKGVRSRS